jgi:hypothetical protein
VVTKKQSELTVVTKAKELCGYIMTVTQKSPKQFRFTFVTRLQNLALDVIERIYRANEEHLINSAKQRLELQRTALTDLKLLAYVAELAMTQNCLLPKQFEEIAKLATDCQHLLGAWINSDKKRITQPRQGGEPAPW